MREFEIYIDSIIHSLRISKKKKLELAEEFKDHLELSKLEYINKGLAENEAIIKAIESFGESSHIQKKLNASLNEFRNIGNVVIGIVITLFMLFFSYIPTAGVIVAYNSYESTTIHNVIPLYTSKWSIWGLVMFVMQFIPIGYFLPVITNRLYKTVPLAATFSIIGLMIGVCLSIVLIGTINFGLLLTFFIAGLTGGMAGYAILIAINRLNISHKNISMKRVI